MRMDKFYFLNCNLEYSFQKAPLRLLKGRLTDGWKKMFFYGTSGHVYRKVSLILFTL